MKKCPICAEVIQDEAIKCRHCGEMLDLPYRPLIDSPSFRMCHVRPHVLDPGSLPNEAAAPPLRDAAATAAGNRRNKGNASKRRTRLVLAALGALMLVLLYGRLNRSPVTQNQVIAPPPVPRESSSQPAPVTSSITHVIATPGWFSARDAVSYIVVDTEDNSMKALTRAISSYSRSELAALPIAKRRTYQIVVAPGTTTAQARATLVQFVLDRTRDDPDLDAVVAFAYDRREDAKQTYTIGRVVWGPNGDWVDVTPEVAQTNQRAGYAFTIDVKEKASGSGTRPSSKAFTVHDALDKELWRDPNEPEDKVIRRVAKSLGMKPSEVKRMYQEVEIWKVQ